MIHRAPIIANTVPQLHLLAVGKISGGIREMTIAPRPTDADTVLAAMNWGRQLHNDGAPRIACANQHEEAGYDEAAAELEAVIDEMHSKPGLDYAPVSVTADLGLLTADAEEHPAYSQQSAVSSHDAEPSWAAFLIHAAQEDDRSDAYAAGASDFANLLPSVAHTYDNAAQQTAYANGYYEAQLRGWAADAPSDYADDCDDEMWHSRGGW